MLTTIIADSNLLSSLSWAKNDEEKLQLIAQFRLDQTITAITEHQRILKEKLSKEDELSKLKIALSEIKSKIDDLTKNKK